MAERWFSRETMPGMDITTDDELRALRARAFGPNADIHDDPAAMRRLHELERRRTEVVQPTAPSDADELLAEFETETEAPGDGTTVAEEAVADAPARRGRRFPVLWVASVVASAAVAASVTAVVTSMAPVSTSSGAPQIATLDPTSSVVVPAGFFGAEEGSLAFEFHGLTIFENARGYGFDGDSDCLTVLRTDAIPAQKDFNPDSYGFDRPAYTGCRIGVFPITVEVPFDVDSPAALVDRFPDGRALQFVRDGDRVGVFLDER